MKESSLEEPSVKADQESEDLVFDTPEKIECIKWNTHTLIESLVFREIEGVFFLDRSARPISWMLNEAWDEEELQRKKPKIFFLNFGQEKQELVHWGGGRDALHYTVDTELAFMRKELKKLKEAGEKDKLKKRIKEIEDTYGANVQEDEDLGFDIELHGKGYDLLEDEKFYSRFFTKEVVEEWTKKFKKMNNKVMFVDDYEHTGGTRKTLQNMFEHHFPETEFHFCPFFNKGDKDAFPLDPEIKKKATVPIYGFQDPGLILPWTEEKAYTLMASEEKEDMHKLTATAERDLEKRKKGLALKKEIKNIFKNE